MNWVQPKFSDFCEPSQPKKKRRLENQNSEVLLKSSSSKGESNIINCVSWVERFKPRSKSDLIVHKKKVEEVESWLQNIDLSDCNILLIVGPSGCGKLTTLKVLCSQLNVGVSEWITPSPQEFDRENYSLPFASQQRIFEDFLIRASRYTSVVKPLFRRRLVIVKEIPNTFIKDNSAFHELLNKYSHLTDIVIVFIISDTSLQNDLFPDDLKNNCGIKTISFNPVTKKAVTTVLTNICMKAMSSSEPLHKEIISGISESSNGDLRHAIMSLNFLIMKGTTYIPVEKKSKSCKTKKETSSDLLSHTINDLTLDIFHGLGRVMYAKRDEKGLLIHNPNEIASSFTSCATTFVGMLEENYLSIYPDIRSARKASNALSLSDFLLQDRKDSMFSVECSLGVAVHGIMTSNSAPIKKFQQFSKSRCSKVEELSSYYKNSVKFNFSSSSVSSILVDSISYLNKLLKSEENVNKKKIVHELSMFNLMKS